MLEHYSPTEPGKLLPVHIASVCAISYEINELVSIAENCARRGVPIPASVVALLKNAKKIGGASATPGDIGDP